MSYDYLIKAASAFEKAAQQKIVLDPKKKNIDFYSQFLYNALASYSQLLRTPQDAKNIFDAIAAHLKSPSYGQDKELKEVDAVLAALQEAENKLQQAGLNAVDVLKQKGMTNVNPSIMNILKSNLQVLSNAQDFSKYQHYYLPRHGAAHPKDVIEIDEQAPNRNNPGY